MKQSSLKGKSKV